MKKGRLCHAVREIEDEPSDLEIINDDPTYVDSI